MSSSHNNKKATKASKVEAVINKVLSLNEDVQVAMDTSSKLVQDQITETSNIKLYESFIAGQGNLNVLWDSNKVKDDKGNIVDNGPGYEERQWNQRELNPVALEELSKATNQGKLLYENFQENALVIGVTRNLLEGVNLAEYQSNDFPRTTFAKLKDGQKGQVIWVNGHHRRELKRLLNKELLEKLEQLKKALGKKFSITSDDDTPETIAARETIQKLENHLFTIGFWAVIFIDIDAILAHELAEEIKAYFARNPLRFHLPDTPNDFLFMCLKSVHGMTVEQGFSFLQKQLDRSDADSSAQIRRVIKNPKLLFVFSDLYNIPMFQKVKILTYSSLANWRFIVPCWLEVFLNFARDSYQYITLPSELPEGYQVINLNDIQLLCDENVAYDYGILDSKFKGIVDEAYKDHLSAVFLQFGTGESIMVNGVANTNWATAFKDYRQAILEKLGELAVDPLRPRKHRYVLNLLVQRVTYILDTAYTSYPYISKLGDPLPLCCETFVKDIATSLSHNEAAYFDFFTLFDPMIAVQHAARKKATTPIDLDNIFRPFARISKDGIVDDNDWVAVPSDFGDSLEKIWAILFGGRGMGISAITSMSSNRDHLRKPGLTQAVVKPGSTDRKVQTARGLVEVMTKWVRQQREFDLDLNQENLSAHQIQVLIDGKKNGCATPPSHKALPPFNTFSFKNQELDEDQLQVIGECINILRSSHTSWALQSKSPLHQYCVSVAVSILELHTHQETIFQYYLGETMIWDLYTKILHKVQHFCPHFVPWHGITEKNWSPNEDQMILTKTTRSSDFGPVIGTGLATSSARINTRYQAGIQKIINTVYAMAAHEDGDTKYLSEGVDNALTQLVHVLAQESVHQAFPFEQDKQYTPADNLKVDVIQKILADRLGVVFPSSDIKVMTGSERLGFYSGDGAAAAYKHLFAATHSGKQKILDDKLAERKAEQVIRKKADKRKNTIEEDEIINRLDGDLTPPPSNQLALTQKRSRAASTGPSGLSPLQKRQRPALPSTEANTQPAPSRKAKGKGKAKAPPMDVDEFAQDESEDAMDVDLSGFARSLSPPGED